MSPSKPAPASAPIDLASLSDDQLALLTVEAPRELERRKAKREAELLAFIREQIAAHGISTGRLRAALSGRSAVRARPSATGGTDGRSRVKAKLWNPKDHSQRWSNAARHPKWFTDHIAAGGTEAACVIPEGTV